MTYKENNLPEEISGSKMTMREIHPGFKQIVHSLPIQGKVLSCRVVGL
jgi:hypothetical protein